MSCYEVLTVSSGQTHLLAIEVRGSYDQMRDCRHVSEPQDHNLQEGEQLCDWV